MWHGPSAILRIYHFQKVRRQTWILCNILPGGTCSFQPLIFHGFLHPQGGDLRKKLSNAQCGRCKRHTVHSYGMLSRKELPDGLYILKWVHRPSGYRNPYYLHKDSVHDQGLQMHLLIPIPPPLSYPVQPNLSTMGLLLAFCNPCWTCIAPFFRTKPPFFFGGG